MTEGERITQDLENWERANLATYALRSAERRGGLGTRFRAHASGAPLEYRTEYHRDRDRILWSSAFRRLQHKTQIFPHYVEDHYRRRLTHSLEVAQIATTLCRALSLNETAAEAIGLGHDIGHAPFGHGGEEALNRRLMGVLTKKATSSSAVAAHAFSTGVVLYGFDHCAHGVEQLCRISQDYAPEHPGLNLSFDVLDGILKHIFDKPAADATAEGRPFCSLENIVRIKLFQEFGDNCGSLEAQCVWFADKVGYLLGDMEDALRAKIFSYEGTKDAELVRLIWEDYNGLRTGAGDLRMNSHEEFLSFKRKALTVLILDCVKASSAQIAASGAKSVEDVLSRKVRLVDVRPELRTAWNRFYQTTVTEQLFRHDSVKACEFKAHTIVEGLFDAYMEDHDLVPRQIREKAANVYRTILADSDQVDLMAIRNYIAGMTDSFAIEQHKRLYMSSERIGI